MITELTLQNIRLFSGGPWTLPLPRLAIFCGTNSAGKSTIIKSLLLLRQSQGIQESQEATKGRLRFVGNQVDVGDYASFVSHNDATKEISLSLTIEVPPQRSLFQNLESISERKSDGPSPSPIKSARAEKNLVTAQFYFEGAPTNTASNLSSKCRLTGILKRAEFEIHRGDLSLLKWRVERNDGPAERSAKRNDYSMFIPRRYLELIQILQIIYFDESADDDYLKFSTVLRGLLPDQIVAKIRHGVSNRQQEVQINWPMPPHIEQALASINEALANLHYLGPLRSPAKRFYLSYQDSIPAIDSTGEFLPSLVRDKASDRVWNCSPGPKMQPKRTSLIDALNIWTKYFRTGCYEELMSDSPEINLPVTSDVLMEIKIRSIDNVESHALTDSGFGFSQVLPIIVKGLLADKGSTVLIEQPELHLNPALQVRMASFLASMVIAGKQIIIETHSEHIVNAIRVLCAEDDSGELYKMCGVFYLSAEGGSPTIKELAVRPNGMVPDWPNDFFGEAAGLTARLLRAQKRHFNLHDRK